MIIHQWHLKQNIKQQKMNDLKYQLLNKCFAQVKAGNNSEKLLNVIRQIVYSLHQSKEIS